MKPVEYSKAASKTLRRMPANIARNITAKINAYATSPQTLGNNVKALKGTDLIRLRVGDWRVLMRDGLVINVIKIAPRGEVYD